MTYSEKFEIFTALERGDVETVKSLTKNLSSKKSFKNWVLSFSRLFEFHLVVKLLGVKLIDFNIPKDGEA